MQVGRKCLAEQGASSPAGGNWRSPTPGVGRVRLHDAARINGCTPYASVYVCLYSCLNPAVHVGNRTPGRPGGEVHSRRQVASFHARGRACAFVQRRTHRWLYALRICSRVSVFLPEPHVLVGCTTPGLPGCEFPSRRQVAISHARRQACAISQRRTHMLLYAFRIRVRVPVCLSPAMQVGRTCSADRGASSLAGGKWISHARGRACSISHCRNNKWLYALRIRLRVLVFLPEPRHARRSHHARPTRGRVSQPAASGELSRPSSGMCDFSTPHG